MRTEINQGVDTLRACWPPAPLVELVVPGQPGILPAVDGALAGLGQVALEAVNQTISVGEACRRKSVDRPRGAFPGPAHEDDRVGLSQSFLGELRLDLLNERRIRRHPVTLGLGVPLGQHLHEGNVSIHFLRHADEHELSGGANIHKQDLRAIFVDEIERLPGIDIFPERGLLGLRDLLT